MRSDIGHDAAERANPENTMARDGNPVGHTADGRAQCGYLSAERGDSRIGA